MTDYQPGGLSQAELSRLSGVSQPTISRALKGETIPSTQTLSRLVTVLESKGQRISLPSLDFQAGNVEAGPALLTYRQLPLVGEVQGGNDGYLMETAYPVGHGEGYVAWPTRDANAYALRVRGDSMHPRYRAGEFVIVEPCIEPQPQDDVVVICVDGRKMLKMLNWITADEVQLLSFNNGYAPITLQRKEVESIQLASGRAPRSALSK